MSSDSSDSESRIRYKTTSTREDYVPPTQYYDDTLTDFRKTEERRKYVRSRSRSHSRDRARSYAYNSSRNRRKRSESLERKSSLYSKSRKSELYRRKSKSPNRSKSRNNRSKSKSPVNSEKRRSNSNKKDGYKTYRTSPKVSRSISPEIKSASCSQNSINIRENKNIRDNSSFNSSSQECSPKKDESSLPIGPALPNYLINTDVKPETDLEADAETAFGPALPVHLLKKKEESPRHTIGPALPPHLISNIADSSPTNDDNEMYNLPPEICQDESEDDDDLIIGPLPSGINPELEQRALEIKLNKLKEKDAVDEKSNAREEWMLELPQIKTITDLGLGARQFRTKERPDFSDRTSWTDTPEEKEKKKGISGPSKPIELTKEQEEQRRLIAKRDKQQEDIANKHKKKHKRDKSLLDIHHKKLKKEQKEREKATGKTERRPFDRSVDLKVNKFDDAQKKAVMKKAQLLDTRFSSGGAKYL